MVEIKLLECLRAALDTPVYLEKPQRDIPQSYVLIEKTGSSVRDLVVNTTFAVQSYGPSLYEAASLNEKVKQAMLEVNAHNEFSKVALNSDYNYTNTVTKEYRYQAVFDVITHI